MLFLFCEKINIYRHKNSPLKDVPDIFNRKEGNNVQCLDIARFGN